MGLNQADSSTTHIKSGPSQKRLIQLPLNFNLNTAFYTLGGAVIVAFAINNSPILNTLFNRIKKIIGGIMPKKKSNKPPKTPGKVSAPEVSAQGEEAIKEMSMADFHNSGYKLAITGAPAAPMQFTFEGSKAEDLATTTKPTSVKDNIDMLSASSSKEQTAKATGAGAVLFSPSTSASSLSSAPLSIACDSSGEFPSVFHEVINIIMQPVNSYVEQRKAQLNYKSAATQEDLATQEAADVASATSLEEESGYVAAGVSWTVSSVTSLFSKLGASLSGLQDTVKDPSSAFINRELALAKLETAISFQQNVAKYLNAKAPKDTTIRELLKEVQATKTQVNFHRQGNTKPGQLDIALQDVDSMLKEMQAGHAYRLRESYDKVQQIESSIQHPKDTGELNEHKNRLLVARHLLRAILFLVSHQVISQRKSNIHEYNVPDIDTLLKLFQARLNDINIGGVNGAFTRNTILSLSAFRNSIYSFKVTEVSAEVSGAIEALGGEQSLTQGLWHSA